MTRDQAQSSPIPRITADFITATDVFANLAQAPLRTKVDVIESIARSGKPVDSLTVGELLQMAKEARN